MLRLFYISTLSAFTRTTFSMDSSGTLTSGVPRPQGLLEPPGVSERWALNLFSKYLKDLVVIWMYLVMKSFSIPGLNLYRFA